MARIAVYQATKYDPYTNENVLLAFLGSRASLKLAALTVIEGTGFEVDENELDANGFYYPKPNY